MLTLLEVLKRTTEHFRQAGLEKPRVDAEWILAHGLGCKRLELYLQFERPLEDEQLAALREPVRQRARREPLQHITGETSFHDLQLKVRPEALIPRPETEELVEKLIQQGGPNPPASLLDLGTGTGAIALALANAFPQCAVTAADKAEPALALARENAQQCGLEQRVNFIASNWFDAIDGTFDWIVSNPPYLTEAEWAAAEPEVRSFEPKEALVAGDDGLAALKAILTQGLPKLNEGGLIACETGIGQHDALAALAQKLGYSHWQSELDLSGRDRFFLAWN